ncbi:MAG: DUF3459 domain-containing protein, partial [Actinobacteria bacterium]|nr:DUF3459 domain-containing protein [Actinomycetota bacterium]
AAPTAWLLENHDIARVVSRYSGAPARVLDPEHPTILDHVPEAELDEEQLQRGTARARAALLMALALPGSFYLYAGGELGLPEVLAIPPQRRDDPVWHRSGGQIVGRDGCRVPLPWTPTGSTFGFNAGHEPWLPQPPGWGEFSVATQSQSELSFLTFTRSALALRRRLGPATDLRWNDRGVDDASGSDAVADPQAATSVLDFTTYGTGAQAVRVIVNFGTEAIAVPPAHQLLRSDLTAHDSPDPDARRFLPPDACVWLSWQTSPL